MYDFVNEVGNSVGYVRFRLSFPCWSCEFDQTFPVVGCIEDNWYLTNYWIGVLNPEPDDKVCSLMDVNAPRCLVCIALTLNVANKEVIISIYGKDVLRNLAQYCRDNGNSECPKQTSQGNYLLRMIRQSKECDFL